MDFYLDNEIKNVKVYFNDVVARQLFTEYGAYRLYLKLLQHNEYVLTPYYFWKRIIESGIWFVDSKDRKIYIVESN